MSQYLAKYLAKLAKTSPKAAEAGNKAMRLAIMDKFANLGSDKAKDIAYGMRDMAEMARGVRPGATAGEYKHGLASIIHDAGLSDRQAEALFSRLKERTGPDLDKFEAWTKIGQPSSKNVMPIMAREEKKQRQINEKFQEMLEAKGSRGPKQAEIEEFRKPFNRSREYASKLLKTLEDQDRVGFMRTGLRPDGVSDNVLEEYLKKRKGRLG